MTIQLHWKPSENQTKTGSSTLIIGHAKALEENAKTLLAQLPTSAETQWNFLLEQLSAKATSDSISTWLSETTPHQLVLGLLPDACSRHNSPSHPHEMTALIQKLAPKKSSFELIIVLDQIEDTLASACAIARAFPTFSLKEKKTKEEFSANIRMLHKGEFLSQTKGIDAAATAIQFASDLVDAPTNELHTDAFLEKARQVSKKTNTQCTVFRGEELKEKGFGGLWGIGRTATHPPALVVLEHKPEKPASEKTFVWVGKGIVYDTGGLSIKSKTGMPGMKGDMAGAAAVLAAFSAAVQMGFPHRLCAVLCLAENSVGSDSLRPDDIIKLYSGRTVEVNNTDAEGRLVLGDGVAYATKHLDPDVLIDLATLTFAQQVATGQRHAGLLANQEVWENRAVTAGIKSGDLLHPLPYCPEFFVPEFKSQVADMKNSVKDRGNAQSSCAGHFIEEHFVDYDNAWVHIDFSGPGHNNERSTGYGVAFLLTISGFNPADSLMWDIID